MIIGLTGVAKSGKDTVGQMLVEKGFKRYAFADVMKLGALNIDPLIFVPNGFLSYPKYNLISGSILLTTNIGVIIRLSSLVEQWGWEEAKKVPEVRRFLQRLGTDFGRNLFGKDFWVSFTMSQIKGNLGNFVITDVRFDNEAESILNAGGMVVKVDRGLTPVNDHVSESGIDPELIHHTIENKGTLEDLREEVDTFLQGIYKGYL